MNKTIKDFSLTTGGSRHRTAAEFQTMHGERQPSGSLRPDGQRHHVAHLRRGRTHRRAGSPAGRLHDVPVRNRLAGAEAGGAGRGGTPTHLLRLRIGRPLAR